jgi:AAA family ATP:ADP antiporter
MKILDTIKQFTYSEKIFILCAMLSGFFISLEYAVVRPVSNCVFISAYGSSLLPYAWICLVPINFLVVGFYHRFLPKFGCFKMFLFTAVATVFMSVFCALFMSKIFILPFLFYLWKEIYVLLMFQQLWSVIHATIPTEKAKFLYGVIFAIGGLGGIIGSMVPGLWAVDMGSENLLFITLPIYAIFTMVYLVLLRHAHTSMQDRWQEEPTLREGLRKITSSKVLMFILAIVALMQITSALTYYQFNIYLEEFIGDKDLRTQYCGQILAVVNTFTVGLQLVGTFLFVHFLGLRFSHLVVPVMLGLNALGSLLFPTFQIVSFAFMTIKAFDFSVFGIIKEMLYIPLSKEEKFQSKAIIDVFAYRSAKAFASLLILIFQAWHAPRSIYSIATMCLFALWILMVVRLFFRKTQPQLT